MAIASTLPCELVPSSKVEHAVDIVPEFRHVPLSNLGVRIPHFDPRQVDTLALLLIACVGGRYYSLLLAIHHGCPHDSIRMNTYRCVCVVGNRTIRLRTDDDW